jgi:ribosomal-protein-alanine N-acetyltransferase
VRRVAADRVRTDSDRLQIAPCRSEDLPSLAILLEQSPEAASWSVSALREVLGSQPRYFLVAWQDQQIVGFICGRRIHDQGEILNLAVHGSFRRRGVGSALVRGLLEGLDREGVTQVFLEVRFSNTRAMRFYRSLQFRQVAERPDYYRNPSESAWVLACGLPGSDRTARTV